MVHSRCGWGSRNLDGNCVPGVVACNLVIGDTCFKKMASHLITYQLGSSFWWMSHMPSKEIQIQGQHNQQVKKKFILHLDMETQGPSCSARVPWCIHSWVWECWLKHSGSYHSLRFCLIWSTPLRRYMASQRHISGISRYGCRMQLWAVQSTKLKMLLCLGWGS